MTVPLDEDAARKVLNGVDALEYSDHVQDVYTHADIPDEVMESIDEWAPNAEIDVMRGVPA